MNPFIEKVRYEYNSVPFADIKAEHFLPAIKHYIKVTEDNIQKIVDLENANFENTILAFDCSSEDLNYVMNVYHHLFGSEADEKIRSLINEINPLTTKLYNDIFLNEKLFSQISKVYELSDSFDSDDLRLTEEIYQSFVRSGANLENDDKEKYRNITEKLSMLSPKFSNNVLNATNSINDFWIDSEKDVKGLPDNMVESAKIKANEKNNSDKWCFSLDTDFFGIMRFCENRSIRKDVMTLFQTRCNGGEFDNSEILKEIATLRREKAKILGFDSHADFILDRRMAQDKETVYNFINELLAPSYDKAKEEAAEISDFAMNFDGTDKLEAYDLMFYGEKYKNEKFDFSDEVLRPYFKSENVIDGVFNVANKLYGLHFEKLNNIQVWHDEVVVYKVLDKDKDYVGLLYQDLHPRPTKRGGAWMNQLQAQGMKSGFIEEPHVTFNCNMTRASGDTPALLSVNEVKTVFHEFGHCLHGLLTNVKYKSLGAMSVYWDFVELPSQILENWLSEPDVLNLFGSHYKTGEKIPSEYIEKLNKSKKFMGGTHSLRQLHLCKIDMAWHDVDSQSGNVEDFEKELLDKYTVLPRVEGAVVSNAFSHIFSGGYSAGYYSYKWAELLEADAYSKFKNDGIFNKDTAASFKENILSKGNTDHPMNLYKKFMGREPIIKPLLEKTGLISEKVV